MGGRVPGVKRGGHIYLRCADGEIQNIKPGTHRDLEIRGNRCYVLTVGSMHPKPADRLNALYTWFLREGDEIPSVTLKDLQGLTDAEGKVVEFQVKASSSRMGRTPSLYVFTAHNSTTREYLQNGATYPEGMRRMSLFDAACDYARCNIAGYPSYTAQDAERDLAPQARTSGLPEDEIVRAIPEAYRFCTKPTYKAKGSTNPKSGFSWQYAMAFSDSHRWNGRKGTADRAVFLALIERARLGSNEKGTFRASVREIGEQARVSDVTAQRVLERLRTASPPLICFAGEDGKTRQTCNACPRANGVHGSGALATTSLRKGENVAKVTQYKVHI